MISLDQVSTAFQGGDKNSDGGEEKNRLEFLLFMPTFVAHDLKAVDLQGLEFQRLENRHKNILTTDAHWSVLCPFCDKNQPKRPL